MAIDQGSKNLGYCEETGATDLSYLFACSQSQVKAENEGGDWRRGLREPETATGFAHV